MNSLPESQRERWLWAFTYVLAALPLLGWWLFGLFDLDEGFYAAVTREMIRTGDWVTPHFNGSPWLEKPILLYWLAAPCVMLFGEDFGPRLPSVLASLALYALMGTFVARRLGPATGRWTVAVLATSPLVAALGRMMMFDSLFVLFLSASLLALYVSFSRNWRWRLLSGALLGFAVLAKGPVAILLFGGTWALVAWRQPDLRRSALSFLPNATAFAGMAATVAIWYLPAYLAAGDTFVQRFLIEQNLGRFAGGDKAHAVPWFLHPIYFPLVIALGMAPWSFRILRGWPKQEESLEPGANLIQFCAHWSLVVLVFFSLSGSKLPHYILPALVPLAVLAARTFSSRVFGLGTVLWSAYLSVAFNLIGTVVYTRPSLEVFGRTIKLPARSEAHAIARWLRQEGGAVVLYEPEDRGASSAPSLQLREPSLPSLSFYLDASYLSADGPEDIPQGSSPTWLYTRSGDFTAEQAADFEEAGWTIEKAQPPAPSSIFEAYRLHRKTRT